MNKIVLSIVALIVIGIAFMYFPSPKDTGVSESTDVLNTTFVIDGTEFALVNGHAEISMLPDSASKETLSIFGAPVYGDLDTDGDQDAAVLLVYTGGGSGTFYYAALALFDGMKYAATEAMFLGDRIAPQTVEIHEGRAVFNFAERRADEPLSAQPSIGKSVWVHYDPVTHSLGEWVRDFEGEANFTERYSGRIDRVDVVFEHQDFTSYRLVTNGLVREGELNTERGFKDDPDATIYVLNWRKPEGEHIYYVRLTSDPTHLYVLDGNKEIVTGSALTREE